MKEKYLQIYLVENYIFIVMIIGTFFVAAMKSAVDSFLKRQFVISRWNNKEQWNKWIFRNNIRFIFKHFIRI